MGAGARHDRARAQQACAGRNRFARDRAALITRWFHNDDNTWANAWITELVREDPPQALHAILLLARTAAEQQPELLRDVLVHGFALLVERNLPEIRAAMADEAKTNVIVRGWIDERRTYGRISPAWQALIAAFDAT